MVIKDKMDLSYLTWDYLRASSGTAGSFLKAFSGVRGRKTYYKLSNFNSVEGIIGHECVNEIIVDKLLAILGIPHLNYNLINADITVNGQNYTTWLCSSKDFKKKNEQKVAFDVFYEINRNDNESVLEFCNRYGWSYDIARMFVVDFLILNRDRHGANIEVLKDESGNVRLAPLFDHGLSLLFNCKTPEEVKNFDVLKDRPVQCFFGSHSTFNNLSLIKDFPTLNDLSEYDKGFLMQDLDGIISKELQDKIWDMIWKRWCIYVDIRNQKQ